MVDFSVKVLVLTDPAGERLPIVIHKETGIPHPEVNQYILKRRRPVVSMKTIKKEADSLCLFLNWFHALEKQDHFSAIESIGAKEIYGLWEYSRKSKTMGAVSSAVHMFRWKVIQKYIEFEFDKKLLKTSYKDPIFKNIKVNKEIILKEMSALNYSTKSRRLSGLEDKTVKKVIEISDINSASNPWIKRDRLRNRLVLEILISLGIRAGELLKIELGDLKLGGSSPSLVIKKKEDDANDPRRNEPRVKTFGRILDLSPRLNKLINEYLRQRRLIPNAKKSKFLFVSHTNGTPLGYLRLRNIISRLEESCPDLYGSSLSPHAFRRTWNDHFREAGESLGIEGEMITQGQNYLQGRRLDSSEAYKYASKHIERSARGIHLKLQEKYLEAIDE